jgi:antitoxin CptB
MMEMPVPQNENRDVRLRRLRMRSWRRGMKEMDLILGNFADSALCTLNLTDLDAHETLMNEPDQDIYAWLSGAYPTPDVHKLALNRILTNISEISSKVT